MRSPYRRVYTVIFTGDIYSQGWTLGAAWRVHPGRTLVRAGTSWNSSLAGQVKFPTHLPSSRWAQKLVFTPDSPFSISDNCCNKWYMYIESCRKWQEHKSLYVLKMVYASISDLTRDYSILDAEPLSHSPSLLFGGVVHGIMNGIKTLPIQIVMQVFSASVTWQTCTRDHLY